MYSGGTDEGGCGVVICNACAIVTPDPTLLLSRMSK
jgi:hypothetical protein